MKKGDNLLSYNNSNMKNDIFYMELALGEANKALKNGNIPVGAVIVNEGSIIAKNRNQVNELQSDIAHAEMLAILQAQHNLYRSNNSWVLYTTLEPCMMCLGAIIYVNIAKLVIAAPAPKVGGLHLLNSSTSYKERVPEIVIGLLKPESRNLIREYVAKTNQRHDLLEDTIS